MIPLLTSMGTGGNALKSSGGVAPGPSENAITTPNSRNIPTEGLKINGILSVEMISGLTESSRYKTPSPFYEGQVLLP